MRTKASGLCLLSQTKVDGSVKQDPKYISSVDNYAWLVKAQKMWVRYVLTYNSTYKIICKKEKKTKKD